MQSKIGAFLGKEHNKRTPLDLEGESNGSWKIKNEVNITILITGEN